MGKLDRSPGPQDYSFVSFIGKNKTMAVMKSAHFKRNFNQDSKPVFPGVGTYDVLKSTDFTRTKVPSIKIGTSVRNSLDEEVRKDWPGPANYNLDERLLRMMKNNSPRPFIGTSTRDILNKTINWPGPASYRNRNNL